MRDILLGASHIGLWSLMLLLYVAVFLLYRHVGRQATEHRLEGRQGPGLDRAPLTLKVDTIRDDSVVLGAISERPSVVIFAAPGCSLCQRLRGQIQSLASDNAWRLNTFIIFRGDKEQAGDYTAGAFESTLSVVSDPDFRHAYRWEIVTVPFGVLLDTKGIVRHKGPISTDVTLDPFFRNEEELVNGGRARLPQSEEFEHDLQNVESV